MVRKPPRKAFSIAGNETDEQAVLERIQSSRTQSSKTKKSPQHQSTVAEVGQANKTECVKRSVAIRVHVSVDFDRKVTRQAARHQVSKDKLRKWFIKNAKTVLRKQGMPVDDVIPKAKSDRIFWIRTSVRLTDAEIERCHKLVDDRLNMEADMFCVGEMFSTLLEGLQMPSP